MSKTWGMRITGNAGICRVGDGASPWEHPVLPRASVLTHLLAGSNSSWEHTVLVFIVIITLLRHPMCSPRSVTWKWSLNPPTFLLPTSNEVSNPTSAFHLCQVISLPPGQTALVQFSQFSRSVVSDSLRPHEPQHARPPRPSPTSRGYLNSCPLSQWRHPTISSSAVPLGGHKTVAAAGKMVSMKCLNHAHLFFFI